MSSANRNPTPASGAANAPIITVTLNPAIDRTIGVPGFAAGRVNRAKESSDRAGGKGVNVAIALAQAGGTVTATGLLGSANRSIFTEAFKRLGIHDAFVPLTGQTRTGLKIVNSQTQETTEINFPGLAATPEALAAVHTSLLKAVGAANRTPWVALCGSLPPNTDATLYAQWTTQLKQAGTCVLLDTSGTALASAIAAGPMLIKPNHDELQGLLGHALPDTRSIIRAARELIDAHGIGLVAVSMGAQGAYLVSRLSAVQASPIKIPVHSTTGAGDAMVAGMLHAIHPAAAQNSASAAPDNAFSFSDTNNTLAGILRCGTAFSLATLQQPRSATPATFRECIAHWLPRIKIDAI